MRLPDISSMVRGRSRSANGIRVFIFKCFWQRRRVADCRRCSCRRVKAKRYALFRGGKIAPAAVIFRTARRDVARKRNFFSKNHYPYEENHTSSDTRATACCRRLHPRIRHLVLRRLVGRRHPLLGRHVGQDGRRGGTGYRAGGLSSGGLGQTDIGNKQAVEGASR